MFAEKASFQSMFKSPHSYHINSFPEPLNFSRSFFQGSQTSPYLFNNLLSSPLCSFYRILGYEDARERKQRTMFHGSSPPYTSLKRFSNSKRFNDSALLNASMTLFLCLAFRSSSSASDHHFRASRKSRNLLIGLSTFFLCSTSDRALYAKESSDVE
jgi:hypothetical protein